jgi:5-methylcytosine-specific restriction endonuclease McrA
VKNIRNSVSAWHSTAKLLRPDIDVPIRPERKSRYPQNWPEISKRIRFERAGNRCEFCGARNYHPHPINGSKVVLTVAHLNHVPEDCRDENLKALCQRCHLEYDRPYHQMTRKIRKLYADLERMPIGEEADYILSAIRSLEKGLSNITPPPEPLKYISINAGLKFTED